MTTSNTPVENENASKDAGSTKGTADGNNGGQGPSSDSARRSDNDNIQAKSSELPITTNKDHIPATSSRNLPRQDNSSQARTDQNTISLDQGDSENENSLANSEADEYIKSFNLTEVQEQMYPRRRGRYRMTAMYDSRCALCHGSIAKDKDTIAHVRTTATVSCWCHLDCAEELQFVENDEGDALREGESSAQGSPPRNESHQAPVILLDEKGIAHTQHHSSANMNVSIHAREQQGTRNQPTTPGSSTTTTQASVPSSLSTSNGSSQAWSDELKRKIENNRLEALRRRNKLTFGSGNDKFTWPPNTHKNVNQNEGGEQNQKEVIGAASRNETGNERDSGGNTRDQELQCTNSSKDNKEEDNNHGDANTNSTASRMSETNANMTANERESGGNTSNQELQCTNSSEDNEEENNNDSEANSDGTTSRKGDTNANTTGKERESGGNTRNKELPCNNNSEDNKKEDDNGSDANTDGTAPRMNGTNGHVNGSERKTIGNTKTQALRVRESVSGEGINENGDDDDDANTSATGSKRESGGNIRKKRSKRRGQQVEVPMHMRKEPPEIIMPSSNRANTSVTSTKRESEECNNKEDSNDGKASMDGTASAKDTTNASKNGSEREGGSNTTNEAPLCSNNSESNNKKDNEDEEDNNNVETSNGRATSRKDGENANSNNSEKDDSDKDHSTSASDDYEEDSFLSNVPDSDGEDSWKEDDESSSSLDEENWEKENEDDDKEVMDESEKGSYKYEDEIDDDDDDISENKDDTNTNNIFSALNSPRRSSRNKGRSVNYNYDDKENIDKESKTKNAQSIEDENSGMEDDYSLDDYDKDIFGGNDNYDDAAIESGEGEDDVEDIMQRYLDNNEPRPTMTTTKTNGKQKTIHECDPYAVTPSSSNNKHLQLLQQQPASSNTDETNTSRSHNVHERSNIKARGPRPECCCDESNGNDC